MKIRSGFVSNSSSLSFMIARKVLTFAEAEAELRKKSMKRICVLMASHCGDGPNLISLDLDILNAIALYPSLQRAVIEYLDICDIVEDGDENSDIRVDPGYSIDAIDVANGPPTSYEEFLLEYDDQINPKKENER